MNLSLQTRPKARKTKSAEPRIVITLKVRSKIGFIIVPLAALFTDMFRLIVIVVLVTASMSVGAAAPKVKHHELACGDTFPCPPEIRRRVDFWIMVFRAWGTNQIIFHDKDRPERVYSVKRTKAMCRKRRSGRAVERERSRVRSALKRIAVKLEKNNSKWTRDEKSILALFPKHDPKTIRKAAKNIRCQQGNKDRFREALKRYGTYRDHILEVLRDHDLSEDMQYLPFVESAFNPRAYSRVGAAGLWQIMPRTARKLGLQLNATIDERFDPEAATWGAARYLRRSTDALTKVAKAKDGAVTAGQINPFVITSYNYGVAGMSRAIKQIGPDYVTVLRKYRSRSFRTAVRNFYASFLAARHVARNSERYFGDVAKSRPLRYSAVSLKRPTSVKRITKVFGVSEKELKALNPALTRNVWKGWRLIPEGYSLRLPYAKDGWFELVAKLHTLPAEQPQLSGRKYVVRRGDTACGIARVFDVRCRDLIQINGLGRRALIRVGQKLDIPGRPATARLVTAKATQAQRKAATKQAKLKRTVAPEPKKLRVAAAGATQDKLEPNSVAVVKEAEQTTEPRRSATSPATPTELLAPLTGGVDGKLMLASVNGKRVYLLHVLPEETLGHYADWLGLGYSSPIRKLNGLKYGRRLRIGQRLKLPIRDDGQKHDFESKRAEYHRTLVDEFREHYDVLGIERYTFKSGDSMWAVAREFELPYWVLTRYNASRGKPQVGDTIQIPTVRARKPQKEPPITDKG